MPNTPSGPGHGFDSLPKEPEERWRRFVHDVLPWFWNDGGIKPDEEFLISLIAVLYQIPDATSAERPLPPEREQFLRDEFDKRGDPAARSREKSAAFWVSLVPEKEGIWSLFPWGADPRPAIITALARWAIDPSLWDAISPIVKAEKAPQSPGRIGRLIKKRVESWAKGSSSPPGKTSGGGTGVVVRKPGAGDNIFQVEPSGGTPERSKDASPADGAQSEPANAPVVAPPPPAKPDSAPAVALVSSETLMAVSSDVRERLERSIEACKSDEGVMRTLGRAREGVQGSWTRKLLEGDSRVAIEASPSRGEVWFAGDIHGDLLAFHLIKSAFEAKARPSDRLVFLGDVIDRGSHEVEVVLELLQWITDDPARIGWIAGKHDLALQKSDGGKFFSRVDPGTFCDLINQGTSSWMGLLGDVFHDTVAALPRALFLPGLLAAHGGFPHSDQWGSLNATSAFDATRCLDDFSNNRWSVAKKKLPNRNAHGCDFGVGDFFGFRDQATALELDVGWFVRGHDHVESVSARWERPKEYGNRVLTVNSLSYNHEEIIGIPPNPRFPTVARWQPVPGPAVEGSTPSDETPRWQLLPFELHYEQDLFDFYAKLRGVTGSGE